MLHVLCIMAESQATRSGLQIKLVVTQYIRLTIEMQVKMNKNLVQIIHALSNSFVWYVMVIQPIL